MLEAEQYLAMRERPDGPAVMHQRWRDLLFLHFSCDPASIQALLPPGIEVDTFEGRAWVGLVPFRMEGVRFRGMPIGLAFPETNVPTYVHREGREPGVWFFSLDAANAVACWVARARWRLPYFRAEMSVSQDPLVYDCRRLEDGTSSHVTAQILDPLGESLPGSLEFFLIERYLLYAHHHGEWMTGRVHHPPYALHRAEVLAMTDGLVARAGIDPRPIEHACYAPGVDVHVLPIRGLRG